MASLNVRDVLRYYFLCFCLFTFSVHLIFGSFRKLSLFTLQGPPGPPGPDGSDGRPGQKEIMDSLALMVNLVADFMSLSYFLPE